MSDLREEVRDRYAAAALAVKDGMAANDWDAEAGCCDPGEGLGVQLYDVTERGDLPEEAVLASLGCGNPTAVAELHEGEVVLDLGSGGGIDVLLSAKRVGPTGKAYGLDMTDEMLELARENARKAEATNVEFLKGYIEDIPLRDGTVDVVISNCVINLSTDKPKVVDEMFRVLRPGRTARDQRRRCRERAGSRRPGGARQLRRLHRRRALVRGVHAGAVACWLHRDLDRAHPRACRPDVRSDRSGAQGLVMSAEHLPEVLFVCVHNAGRSQMAAALLERHAAGRVVVRSAGSTPADEINPAVVAVMAEIGIDLSEAVPKILTTQAVEESDVVVTMGCGDACPVFPGKRYLDWELDDPAGRSVDEVRGIRDQIDERVKALVGELLTASD